MKIFNANSYWEHMEAIFDEGHAASEHGCSDNCNPYKGAEGEEWLDGWREATGNQRRRREEAKP